MKRAKSRRTCKHRKPDPVTAPKETSVVKPITVQEPQPFSSPLFAGILRGILGPDISSYKMLSNWVN